ncbi:MAG TPA: hypothetical protein DCS93_19630 [Microscillaceae bacterium]|nr:hypothetical protein [Microscillaceae bacterium]
MSMQIPPIEELSPKQFNELSEILTVFSKDDFRLVFRRTFGVSLETGVGTERKSKDILILDILEWAEKGGRISQLLEGMIKHSPSNPSLRGFVQEINPTPHIPPPPSYPCFKESVSIDKIAPVHIMDTRKKFHQDFYYQRPFDEHIFELAMDDKNLLLIGNSLAGKTRAIYELIKKLAITRPQTQILFPLNVSVKKNQPLSIPKITGHRHIAFIEDIDDYYKSNNERRQNYDFVIKELVRNDVQMFATCRTGPEYQSYKKEAHSKVKELFEVVKVDKINQADLNQFQERLDLDIERPRKFDGNIGSLFMKIQKMKDRYETLAHHAKNVDDDVTNVTKIAHEILKALKAFYYSSNYFQKNEYSRELVQDYTLRRLLGKFASDKKVLNEFQLKLNRATQPPPELHKFKANFDYALEYLRSDDDHLNFIELGKTIKTEEVYLETLVSDYPPARIMKHISDLYDADGEQQKFGFFVKVLNFNKMIADESSYKERLNLFKRMKQQQIKPDADTFALLIAKSSEEQAFRWFDKFKNRKLEANESILTNMVMKCSDFENAFAFLEKFLAYQASKDDQETNLEEYLSFFHQFAKQITTKEQITKCLRVLKLNTGQVFTLVFNEIMLLSKIKLSHQQVLTYLQQYAVVPDNNTWVLLIQRGSSFEQQALFSSPYFTDIKVEISVLLNYIKHADSFETALQYLDYPIFSDLIEHQVTFNELINQANSLERALELFDHHKLKNITPNTGTLNDLIRQANSLDQALELFNHHQLQGILPNTGTVNQLINRSNSLEKALQLFQQHQFKKIKVNTGTLNELIRQADSLDQALKLLKHPQLKNIIPDTGTLNDLINRAHSLEEALELLNHPQLQDIPPDSTTLNELIRQAHSLEKGLALLKAYRLQNVYPKVGTLNDLIKKTNSLEKALDLLDHHHLKSIKADNGTLNELIEKSKNLEVALLLFKKDKLQHIKLNQKNLNVLVKFCKNTQDVKTVIQLLIHNNYPVTFYFLEHITFPLSKYKDLNDIDLFWQSYKQFSGFDFLDKQFASLSSILDHLDKYERKIYKLHINHLLYIAIGQRFILNKPQKEKLWQAYKSKRNSKTLIHPEDTLYEDILEMWNNYEFPDHS